MRRPSLAVVVALLVGATALASGACKSTDDNASTDDSSEINEGRGELDRDLKPTVPIPTSAQIGAKLDAVFTKAVGSLSSGHVVGGATKQGNDCSLVQVKLTSGHVAVERETCTGSDTVRVFASDNTVSEEHLDANKDGLVDRFTGKDGTVSQYEDTNFDGKVDVVVESVDAISDFSTKGYGETLPKSDFLFRVREDRDRDGQLDHEKLTAKGALPPAPDPAAAP